MKTVKRSRLKNNWKIFCRWFCSKRGRQFLSKAAILIIAAVFLTWLLEYRHFLNDASRVWQFVLERPKVFFYNSLVIFFIVLGTYGLFRKVFTAIAVDTALILAIGYIHIAKFNFRGMPLFPEDFQFGTQAGTLTKFIDPWSIVRVVIAIILTIVLGCLLDRLTKKWLASERPTSGGDTWWKRHHIVSRAAIILIAIAGFMVTTDFVRNHGGEREVELGFLDSKFIDWNQVQNYENNGFLIGFLYNTRKLQLQDPAGYNEEKIAEIRNSNLQSATQDETGRNALADSGINVVTILEESFFDPENIREYYHYDGEVMPNLHRLQTMIPHGTMYSVDYGGGTANIEFEVQTGLTNYFLKTVPYTNLLPYQETVPSLASFAKSNNYDTATVHSFNGGMYKRNIVLPKMGFDEFITEAEFDYTEKDGSSSYINDRSAYNQLLKVLDEHDKPMYVSLLTMQNHAPYLTNEYGESQFKVTNVADDAKRNAIETYLMTAHLSDQYLGEFYDKLQKLDEKTVVLLYGDHSPGVFPDVIESKDKAVSDQARHTPYLIFANFDLGNAELPTTTPNCLSNTMFNMLNLNKPDYYYLLDKICEEEPVLTDSNYINGAPIMNTALSQYELLSFDLAAGKQYYLHQ